MPEPTVVYAPYDATADPFSSFRFLSQFNGNFQNNDIKIGVAIVPKFKNIYEKNIGYIGLSRRVEGDYLLWRLGLFVDGYQSFKNEAQGGLKTRINLYLRQHNTDEDIGVGVGAHTVFQPKKNRFYSIGFEARPVFFTFDWSDATYLEVDMVQELRAFFNANVSVYAKWLVVGQFEGSLGMKQPINRLSLGITLQR
ncbi:hypothetical protein [Marinicellulosiphila megalodicopiae]|uniref:hypothetical protein n=1 Tax=Marinicellulosiphila megalodicopiae TaxID=2724896 RepID=UPI003BAEC339